MADVSYARFYTYNDGTGLITSEQGTAADPAVLDAPEPPTALGVGDSADITFQGTTASWVYQGISATGQPFFESQDGTTHIFLSPDGALDPGDPVPPFAPDAYCFLAGTMIATPEGERAVETLAAGDLVLTASGQTRPVLWVGRQTVAAVFADPMRSYPVRVAAGALAEGVPTRDLYVSPDHGVLVDDVLVQASALVNGTTITRVTQPEATFTYYHIELEDHALVLANGTAAETFVDNVSRRQFDNHAEYDALFGDSRARIPELDLPRVKSARQLSRVLRDQLAARAAALGFLVEAAA
ncbi:Hint domain-containing protein [Chelatococcus reniformis]|uniref:Hedgehog/Intein (Hint) domain-containing protein n=1 Tax=Chelatococcus reniformis TaxID=1494448 RepID=A0A916U1A1_9HYPH|nr:Hint domain-containing protein [Chelatococcus reniformis]GGC55471.1 hypothetical protein GCM10010994_12920 [Chelatococcus reniformis]